MGFMTLSLGIMLFVSTDTDAPPLANRDVRNLVILTELPFVVPFLDRVKVMPAGMVCINITCFSSVYSF